MLLTIIIFVLVLSVLVFVHELGHFYTARRFGVKAEEFGLGFPPRVIGWYKNRAGRWRRVVGGKSAESLENSQDESLQLGENRTIYSLNALPIGGFVKIKGENGEGKDEPDSFGYQKIWKRIIILSAGVIMNALLAWILLSVGYVIGLPQAIELASPHARISESQVNIVEVLSGSPAEQAGLKAGDAVLSVDGTEVGTEQELQDSIAAAAGRITELRIRRSGEAVSLSVTPEAAAEGERATIGVAIFSSGLVSYPVRYAFWEGAKTTVWLTGEIGRAFGGLFHQIFSGQDVSDQFAGPVGIATITGQAARLGFSYLLQFAALLSLNLAILNILPFPALDGGRILFLLIEKVKGRPVRKEVEAFIHNAGFMLLIALVIFITYKDIIKLF